MSTVRYEDVLLPFGKFKGKLICEIPNSYLSWLLDQDWMVKDWPNIYVQCQLESKYREDWNIRI